MQAALNKWRMRLMKADNTSAIVVLIDPLGPRKLSILRKKREEKMKELAERRVSCSKSVTDLLIANETLNKSSPKKVKDKAVINSIQNKARPVILDTCKVGKDSGSAAMSATSGQHADVPGKESNVTVNLDDSIQLRNGHIVTPIHHDAKHVNHASKSTPVANKNKSSVQAASSEETVVSTRMATRHSPQKSPLSQNSVSNSQSSVPHVSGRPSMQSRLGGQSSASQGDQNCLQPSKCTLENVKNTVTSKVQPKVKVKDLENIYSSVVQFSKGQLSVRTNQKLKSGKVETSTSSHNSHGDAIRSTKKAHTTKSLSTRISLRLRRLRQKTQKIRAQGENKSYVMKPGVKRKLDPGHSSSAPASKKVRHS